MIDFYMEEEKIIIVCEFVNGILLSDIFLQNKVLDETSSKSLMYKLLLGINHMHESNVIHRDLKLENLFVKIENSLISEVRIVDFGLAVSTEKYANGVCGTYN